MKPRLYSIHFNAINYLSDVLDVEEDVIIYSKSYRSTVDMRRTPGNHFLVVSDIGFVEILSKNSFVESTRRYDAFDELKYPCSFYEINIFSDSDEVKFYRGTNGMRLWTLNSNTILLVE